MQEPGPPGGPPPTQGLPGARKKRSVYLKNQLQEMEDYFCTNQYPNYKERVALAARLNLEEHQVLMWFKNHRAKHARLQRPPVGPGRGAPAPAPQGHVATVPQGVSAPAPPFVLFAASGPDPAPPWVPGGAGSAFPGGPGFCLQAPHSPWTALPAEAAEPLTSNLSPAPWTWQGSQEWVPAARALAPAGPHRSPASAISPAPDSVLAPNFTAVVSPQDPLEGSPFPRMAQSQEGEEPAEVRDSDSDTEFVGDSVPRKPGSYHGARGD